MNAGAVKIEGHEAILEVSYVIPNVESDSNSFREVIGGRFARSEDEAIKEVIDAAKAFAEGLRERNPDAAVWDALGNHY